jgi:hypothetical protein
VLDIYHHLIRPRGRERHVTISKLNVWRMLAPESDVDVDHEMSSPCNFTMPSWLRSIHVGTQARLEAHPTLLAELVVDISRIFGGQQPFEYATRSTSPRPFYDRQMTHFDFCILSQSWTKECAIALAEAVSIGGNRVRLLHRMS